MATSCMSKCIICFCTFKSEPCKNPEYFTSVFKAFCRLLEINLIKGTSWNFDQDDIPFCLLCCSFVEKLKGLYDELDALQQNICKIFRATIPKSGSVTHLSNELNEEFDRVSYIRHEAIKSCNQLFENSVNVEEITEAPQDATDLFLKLEVNEEDNNEITSSLLDCIDDEYEFQNQIDLIDPMNTVNNDSHIETEYLEGNNLPCEDVKVVPALLPIPSEANDEIVENPCTTSDVINTDPDDTNKCQFCEKIFRRKCSLKLHLKRHLQEEQHKCENCDEIFDTTNTLELHRREIHNSEGEYKCEVCHKDFCSTKELQRHTAMHTPKTLNLNKRIKKTTVEKPYKCDTCSKHFSRSHYLVEHIKIHTGEKPFKCDVCDHSFTQLSVLKTHRRIHTGEKPYKCDLCDKCFNQSTILNQHRRIHTGEKPFKCETCNKCFLRRQHLISHVRIHTQERPYQCDSCGHCFRHSNALYRHRRMPCKQTEQIAIVPEKL